MNSFVSLLDGDELESSGPQEAEADEEAMEEQQEGEITGQDLPEFPIIEPTFKPAGREDTLFAGEMQLTERPSVKDLKEAAKLLNLSTWGSKSKNFNRVRDCYEQSLKRRQGKTAKLCPEPRTQNFGCARTTLRT